MYAIPGSERCPVTAYLKYVGDSVAKTKKLPAKTDEWYDAVPVGKNTLGDKMKKLSKIAGCSKVYTNHSLRATCVTSLDNAGFASRDIMAVSGHKSESSLKHYVKTSDAKKKCMSAALAKQMNQQPDRPEALTVNAPSTSSAGWEDKQVNKLPALHTSIIYSPT
jgi:hypothetical protein